MSTKTYSKLQLLDLQAGKYVNLVGLANFWQRVKVYVDSTDNALNERLIAAEGGVASNSDKILAIAAGTKIVASAKTVKETKSNTIRKDESTLVEFSATIDNPLNLTQGSLYAVELGQFPDRNEIEDKSLQKTLILTNKQNKYAVYINLGGMEFMSVANVYAVYPTYYGFLDNSNASLSNPSVNALTSINVTSSLRTYTETSKANNVVFVLLVPTFQSEVTLPTSLTMGGAPVSYTEKTVTIKDAVTDNNVSYKMYYTNSSYNDGKTLQIKAS